MAPKTPWDLRVESLTRGVIRWRWPILLATLLLSGAIGSGARGLFFDTDYAAFFGDENPQLTAYEELQDLYTKNDNVLFVVEPANGDAFSQEALLAVEELTEAGWQLPYSIRLSTTRSARLAVVLQAHSYHSAQTKRRQRRVRPGRRPG